MPSGRYNSYWDKIELYIMSLWLLFLLIILINFEIPSFTTRSGLSELFMTVVSGNVISLCAALFLLLGLIYYLRFRYRIHGSKELPFTVTRIENINFEHLTFLTTYIIPMICFDLSNLRYAIVLLVLLVLIGAIYVMTDMFYANPTLALLGYRVYKADGHFMTGNRENIILIALEKIEIDDKLHYMMLDERIYFVRVADD